MSAPLVPGLLTCPERALALPCFARRQFFCVIVGSPIQIPGKRAQGLNIVDKWEIRPRHLMAGNGGSIWLATVPVELTPGLALTTNIRRHPGG